MSDDKIVPFTPKESGNPNAPAVGEFPPSIPGGFGSEETGLAGMDVEAFFNIRDWVRDAVVAKGARMTGGGMGCGVCDIDIELDGHHYNLTIKPLRR
jgi:hypothetical protein